jgi:hypothetical protein
MNSALVILESTPTLISAVFCAGRAPYTVKAEPAGSSRFQMESI